MHPQSAHAFIAILSPVTFSCCLPLVMANHNNNNNNNNQRFILLFGFILAFLLALGVFLGRRGEKTYQLTARTDRFTAAGNYVDTFQIYTETYLIDPTPRTTTTTTSSSSSRSSTHTENVTFSMRLGSERTVQNVSPEYQKVVVKITQATMNISDTSGQKDFYCDTTTKNTQVNEEQQQQQQGCGPLSSILDKTEEMYIDKTGRVVNSTGPDLNVLQEIWTGEESDHHHSDHMDQSAIAIQFLPSFPVRQGSQWTEAIEFGKDGNFTGKAEFVGFEKYTGVQCAKIESVGILDVNIDSVMNGMFGSLYSSIGNIESEMEFFLWWDNDKKIVRRYESYLSMLIDVPNPETGENLQVPVKEFISFTTDFK